jgi:hypothetical protein
MIERFPGQLDAAKHARDLENAFFLIEHADTRHAACFAALLGHAQVAVCLGCNLWKMRDAEYLTLFAKLA